MREICNTKYAFLERQCGTVKLEAIADDAEYVPMLLQPIKVHYNKTPMREIESIEAIDFLLARPNNNQNGDTLCEVINDEV